MSSIISFISTAFSAAWGWFGSLTSAVPGIIGFFLAVFTFYCISRFLVLPLLGGTGLSSHSRKEERPKNE